MVWVARVPDAVVSTGTCCRKYGKVAVWMSKVRAACQACGLHGGKQKLLFERPNTAQQPTIGPKMAIAA